MIEGGRLATYLLGTAFGVLAVVTWRLAVGLALRGGVEGEPAGRRVSLFIMLHFLLLSVIVWPYRQTLADIWGAGGLATGLALGFAWVAWRAK